MLAGVEWSNEPNIKLNADEIAAVKAMCVQAAKRDYPARLVEIIQTWEARLFYRGFQFLFPARGGGWIIPGESTGYGPAMQLDLALLPTNIYSARSQMLVAALTRVVPTPRFAPGDTEKDSSITAAESAEKFRKIFARNNDLIMIQTDAAVLLWNDGRFIYWTRFVKDGQRFGWEDQDEPDDIVPETEPAQVPVAALPEGAHEEGIETAAEETTPGAEGEAEYVGQAPIGEQEEAGEEPSEERKPRGQEVRTAHGKLETKICPMSANSLDEAYCVQLDIEYDISTAKGMFPWVASNIKPGSSGIAEGEIARLARQNVKLGMQSSYVTSDSTAQDVTVQRSWFKKSAFMGIEKEEVRESLISKFPDGMLCCFAGEVFCYARNEAMDDSLALANAYAGDGQNRNALGTSTIPIQKRLNNWLDLMNDCFVRAIPKKWMHNKAFDVQAVRQQTNIPGDVGPYTPQPGLTADQLVFVEPRVEPPTSLADFVKEYSGPLAELLSGAYPALAGGDVGTADSGVAIATQRDSALGRLAPTWHAIKKAEVASSKQAVRWAAKCRDNSINEKVPGGETIKLEINDLKGNILCFAESDENFPETWTQRKNAALQIFDAATKNPPLAEVMFNAVNLEFWRSTTGLDIYIPQILALQKQLGELELLMKGKPVPNPQVQEAMQGIAQMKAMGVPEIELQQATAQLSSMPQMLPSVPIYPEDDDQTEKETLWKWMNEPVGRKFRHTNPEEFANVQLHYQAHEAALSQKQAQQAGAGAPKKPPSQSMNYKDLPPDAQQQMLAEVGIVSKQTSALSSPANGTDQNAAPIPVQ